MSSLKIGDFVARKSYSCDVTFEVREIIGDEKDPIVVLKGVSCRLIADSPESDLVIKNDASVERYLASR